MSKITKQVEAQARRMCRHTVVFGADTADEVCAVMALQGRTNKAIAMATGLSETAVQYRITKAQGKGKFRYEYRNGTSALSKQMAEVTRGLALRVVQYNIAPKWLPLARPGISKL